jgi:hypothetical protein
MRPTHVIQNVRSGAFLCFSGTHYSGLGWASSIEDAQRFTDHDDAQAFLKDSAGVLGDTIMNLDIVEAPSCS